MNEINLLSKLRRCTRVVRMFDYEYCKEEAKLFVVMEKGDSDLGAVLTSFAADSKVIDDISTHAVCEKKAK